MAGLRQSEPVDAVDPSLGEPVRWFERPATVGVDLEASADAAAGDHEATVEVRFGVCDDQIFLPPQTRTLSVPLVVVAGTGTAAEGPAAALAEAPDQRAGDRQAGDQQTPGLETGAAEEAADSAAAAPLRMTPVDPTSPTAEASPAPVRGGGGESLAGFLLLAVGAGLAALLTPCVFPLVPLTVGAFSHDVSRGRAVARALGFGVAVVAVFTALGAAASERATLGLSPQPRRALTGHRERPFGRARCRAGSPLAATVRAGAQNRPALHRLPRHRCASSA